MVLWKQGRGSAELDDHQGQLTSYRRLVLDLRPPRSRWDAGSGVGAPTKLPGGLTVVCWSRFEEVARPYGGRSRHGISSLRCLFADRYGSSIALPVANGLSLSSWPWSCCMQWLQI